MKSYLALLLLGFAMVGCASHQNYSADRTQKLREMYPPGMSRTAVQARWGQTQPDFSASRPSSGWETYPNAYIAKKLAGLETGTGKKIESLARYWGPDGLSSLCYCWYYYDSDSRIVDVEWEYKSD